MASSRAPSFVHVIDDDPAVRRALDSLFRSVGLETRTYESAADFLERAFPSEPGCLVVDIRLPDMSGLDFQDRISSIGLQMPVILLTGHADVPMTVRGMKAGAVDFLTKPFRDQEMLDAVIGAIEKDRARIAGEEALGDQNARYATLSARERQVMDLVTSGKMNKQVAGELGLSEITVKIHRGSVMRKMQVRTLPDLVRVAETLKCSNT
jgi:FixJ family two-component response regulator